AGLASGLFNTTQQIGMALGVAVLTTLAAARTEALGAAGAGAAEALTGGYRLAFAVGTGLLLAALAVAATVLHAKTPARPQTPEAPEALRTPQTPEAPQAPRPAEAEAVTAA
ncbi:MFS transporter, partial [Streptomyces misionensis]